MSAAQTFYRWAITPLSPVHIGSGAVFEPTQYVVHRGALCEFDMSTLGQILGDKDREDLLRIVTQKASTAMILAVQRFFAQRAEKLAARARQRIPLSIGYRELYDSRIGRVVANQGADRQIFNNLSIKRLAYPHANTAPYLPGSSLKGAIRTALLHAVNQGNGRQKEDWDGLHPLQSRLLRYQVNGKPRLELDPLRQIRIGDAMPTTEIQRRVYQAVNRKKNPPRSRNPEQRGSGRESPDEYLECLLPQARAFVQDVELWNLRQALGSSTKGIPERSFTMQEIAQACTTFYRKILDEEIRAMGEQGYLSTDWAEAINRFLQDHARILTEGKAFLVRVGHHSGAESVTLPGMREIKILSSRGAPKDHATTWWMAAEHGKDQPAGLLPFGWAFVEVQPAGSTDYPGIPLEYRVSVPDPAPEAQPASPEETESVVEIRLKYRRQNGTLSTADERASVTGDDATRILAGLPPEVRRKLSENQCFDKFLVTISGRTILSVQRKA